MTQYYKYKIVFHLILILSKIQLCYKNARNPGQKCPNTSNTLSLKSGTESSILSIYGGQFG